jgi:hypothetical protein
VTCRAPRTTRTARSTRICSKFPHKHEAQRKKPPDFLLCPYAWWPGWYSAEQVDFQSGGKGSSVLRTRIVIQLCPCMLSARNLGSAGTTRARISFVPLTITLSRPLGINSPEVPPSAQQICMSYMHARKSSPAGRTGLKRRHLDGY